MHGEVQALQGTLLRFAHMARFRVGRRRMHDSAIRKHGPNSLHFKVFVCQKSKMITSIIYRAE